MTEHFLDVEHTAGPSSHRLLMPHSSIAGSVSGLSVTSRTSRVSHATTIRSVATLTDTLKTKTGLSIPILPDAIFTNVQRGSVLAATYSIIQGLFAIVTGCFDIYSLSLAAPGSSHYGFYLFSYDFVYSGNPHVRNTLMLFGGITAFGGVCLIVTSVVLLQGLRKEIEFRMEPWIWCMALFTGWRILITIYSSVVNDMVFAYHVVKCLLWILFVAGNIFAWLVVHSFYHELCEVTRLEDVARVKVSCISAWMKLLSVSFLCLSTKTRLAKALVFPVVTYGSESWVLDKAERKREDSFEMRCCRRRLIISWNEKKTSAGVWRADRYPAWRERQRKTKKTML